MKNVFIQSCIVFLGLGVSVNAGADNLTDQQKLATVKHLYQEGVLKGRNTDKLFSADLNAVFKRDEKLAERDGIACLDYDPFLQAQDYDEKEVARTLKFKLMPQGTVRATFKLFKKNTHVDYVLKCQGKSCVVDDILEPQGSFKKTTNACLDELK